MRIGIFTFGVIGQAPWDPDLIRTGITGSEEAVIYMSKELAALGHSVLVFGDPPSGSTHALHGANPRFVSRDFPLEKTLDVAIAWRWPEIGSILKARKIAARAYLWPHDILAEPASSEGFDGVFWLSEWQRLQWASISPEFARFTAIFGNGIEPKQFQPIVPRTNPYSCIYGSNYGRGLEILLQIWPEVKKEFPKASLDIYYGWQHWGQLTKETERWMRDAIERLPDVKEHGQVGHEELNRAYARASLWTYPCIKPEVFCITALRAKLAGAIPVILEWAALKETVRFGFKCQSKEEYLPRLLQAMASVERIPLEERSAMGQFVLENYTWKAIAARWQELLLTFGT